MKRNDSPLKDVLNQWMKGDKYRDRLLKIRIEKIWHESWGHAFGRHTRDIHYGRGILYIHMDSAVLRHELNLQRELLLERLNDALGEEVIKEVKLR